MTLRTRYVTWLGLACSLAIACESEYSIDDERFCEQFAEDANCERSGQGSGASGGTGGAGGSAPSAGSGGSGAGSSGAGTGGGSGCEAPKVTCGEACVDTQSDAKNCGECGYACEGESACQGSACAPFAVASGVLSPFAFALDASSLYFVSPARTLDSQLPPAVQKVNRDGGTPGPVFDDGQKYRSRSLALFDGTLYFGDLDSGQLRRGLTTGGNSVQHVSGSQSALQQLVVANDDLWWIRIVGGNSSLCLGALSENNSSACVDDNSGGYDGIIKAFALEGDVAYWVSASGNPAGLWSRPIDFAQNLVSDASMVTLALRPGTDTIFVATSLGLGSASKATPQASLTPLPTPVDVGGVVQGLTVSGEHLYWLAFEVGRGGEAGAAGAGGAGAGERSLALHRSGLDGSGARVLGRVPVKSPTYWVGPFGPSQLTVDGGFVYFADPGTVRDFTASDPTLNAAKGEADGAIYRLPQ